MTKSTRLTNDLRDRIISKIVDDNYKEKTDTLMKKAVFLHLLLVFAAQQTG